MLLPLLLPLPTLEMTDGGSNPYRPTTVSGTLPRTRNTPAGHIAPETGNGDAAGGTFFTHHCRGLIRHKQGLLVLSQVLLLLLAISTLALVATHHTTYSDGCHVIITVEEAGNADQDANTALTAVGTTTAATTATHHEGTRKRKSGFSRECDVVDREELLSVIKTAVSNLFLIPSGQNNTSLIQVLVQDMALRLLEEQRKLEEQQYFSSETHVDDDGRTDENQLRRRRRHFNM